MHKPTKFEWSRADHQLVRKLNFLLCLRLLDIHTCITSLRRKRMFHFFASLSLFSEIVSISKPPALHRFTYFRHESSVTSTKSNLSTLKGKSILHSPTVVSREQLHARNSIWAFASLLLPQTFFYMCIHITRQKKKILTQETGQHSIRERKAHFSLHSHLLVCPRFCSPPSANPLLTLSIRILFPSVALHTRQAGREARRRSGSGCMSPHNGNSFKNAFR